MLVTDTKKTRWLRAKCHELLDIVFGNINKTNRYKWLKKRGYALHMSEMNDSQLECLRYELLTLEDDADKNIYRKKK